jgi:hypothetical protein
MHRDQAPAIFEWSASSRSKFVSCGNGPARSCCGSVFEHGGLQASASPTVSNGRREALIAVTPTCATIHSSVIALHKAMGGGWVVTAEQMTHKTRSRNAGFA